MMQPFGEKWYHIYMNERTIFQHSNIPLFQNFTFYSIELYTI